jgi:hypothetical protein
VGGRQLGVNAELTSANGPDSRLYRTCSRSTRRRSCEPRYYGSAPLHIPNNTDRTVTPPGGETVQKENCFAISDADPAIAQVRKTESSEGGA